MIRLWVTLLCLTSSCWGQNKPKNVLFFISDDCRPNFNKAYNQSYMHTPNMDKFADESLVFNRAYTQFAICSCSRNSFLSGRRPDKTKVWNFITNFRQVGPNWISLPEYFKKHNYTTLGGGKIYHPGHPPHDDEPKSWSQDYPYFHAGGETCEQYHTKDDIMCPGQHDISKYRDWKVNNQMLEELRYAHNKSKTEGKPFFIGIGIHKPHIPWVIPQHFTDIYGDPAKVPTATDQYPPKGAPPMAFTAEWDGKLDVSIRKGFYAGGTPYQLPAPNNTQSFPQDFQRSLRVGYYGAVSYMDHLFGLAMTELEKLGLKDDTLVVFTADHGYQLGEHDEWGKHTNWELATRVPLIVRAPWMKTAAGKKTDAFAELQDLYKTMAELTGLPDPGTQIDGESLVPVFQDPSTMLKDHAFSQYSRCRCHKEKPPCRPANFAPDWYLNNCENVPAKNITWMGYTVRNAEWRYTEWAIWNGEKLLVDWSQVVGQELYSHKGDDGTDFNSWENENVVQKHPEVVTQLQPLLRKYAPGMQGVKD